MPDVNIKVDGDTTSFDASVDRSVAKTKEIGNAVKEAHEPLRKMGEFSNDALKTLTGFAVPLTAAGAAMALIEGATEAWRGQLEKARDVMREVTALHEKFASAGMGGRSVELINAMRASADGLSNEEMGGVFQGTTGASGLPNATKSQLIEAAKSAQLAKEAGMDTGSFAKTRASLVSSGVKHADSTAFYLERYAPDTKDDALGAIRKYPDQADDIARLYQAAGREEGKGQKGLKEIIQKALGEYGLEKGANPGMTSSFMDAMNGAVGRRAAGDRSGELNRQFLMRQVSQPIDDDEMERRAIDNDKDPALHARRIQERNERFAATSVETYFGDKALGRETKASRRSAAAADEPLGLTGLHLRAVAGMFKTLLGGTASPAQRNAMEKEGYIDNGGDMTLDDFVNGVEKTLPQRQVKPIIDPHMGKLIDTMNRRRLSAQSSQNGDK